MRSQEDLIRKLAGWYPTYRGKLLLLKSNTLTKEEYILHEVGIAIADWDKKNRPKTYGTFILAQVEIESLMGWKAGFVSRYSKKLYKLGFWKKRDNGRTQVNGFELIEIKTLESLTRKNKIVDLQKYLAALQSEIADRQDDVVEMQGYFPKEKEVDRGQHLANMQGVSPISDIVSSKNPIHSFSDTKRSSTDQDGLSESDKEWIEENLSK